MIISDYMTKVGQQSVKASAELKSLSTKAKDNLLLSIAENIRNEKDKIITANNEDLNLAKKNKMPKAMLNRLMLDSDRIEGIAKSVEEIVKLPDPIGKNLYETERPNGLIINRISVPLGVIGIIYESRPNVTVDASVLCIKAGNVVILRGGSESFNSNAYLTSVIQSALIKNNLDKDIVQCVKTTDRAAVDYMLAEMSDTIDVIIPRGGKGLVKKVQDKAKVPVIGHLEGICHIYVNKSANLNTAIQVIHNAKLRRTEICGAAETLLIDREYAKDNLDKIITNLYEGGCEIRGDIFSKEIDSRILLADEKDWSTEYLDAIISIKLVENIDEAIDHIAKYGSGHTESIIAENKDVADKFLSLVDSAIVMHNASTQFAVEENLDLGQKLEFLLADFMLEVQLV